MRFKIAVYALNFFLLLSLFGCDAFVRKFTRKPKHEQEVYKEVVLQPQEYKSTMSKEEYYRQHFLYWKSWQSELIEALNSRSSHKKQVGSIAQAIINLENMRKMLNQEKQKALDVYIEKMNALRDDIKNDVYSSSAILNRQKAEQIRRQIFRYFSYNAVKDDLA